MFPGEPGPILATWARRHPYCRSSAGNRKRLPSSFRTITGKILKEPAHNPTYRPTTRPRTSRFKKGCAYVLPLAALYWDVPQFNTSEDGRAFDLVLCGAKLDGWGDNAHTLGLGGVLWAKHAWSTISYAARRVFCFWRLWRVLLGYDVVHSGRGALHTQAEIAAVAGERVVGSGVVARFVAFNVTPLGWTAYPVDFGRGFWRLAVWRVADRRFTEAPFTGRCFWRPL